MKKEIYTPMESILVNWVKALTPKDNEKKEGENNG
jgi:hypothetical protein